MPVYMLSQEIVFPPVEEANEFGILAIGGDLSVERLIEAYSHGIFPWYTSREPIIWWSPDPRFVLFPEKIKISKSMRQVLQRELFTITYDKAFDKVIRKCRKSRKDQAGTWITKEMVEAYNALHEQGLAHSIEAWQDNKLVGGLYGVSLGKCFFGESMFAEVSNASKAAFITLTRELQKRGFLCIDCQVHTKHLESLGAVEIARTDFINILNQALHYETMQGDWGELLKSD